MGGWSRSGLGRLCSWPGGPTQWLVPQPRPAGRCYSPRSVTSSWLSCDFALACPHSLASNALCYVTYKHHCGLCVSP